MASFLAESINHRSSKYIAYSTLSDPLHTLCTRTQGRRSLGALSTRLRSIYEMLLDTATIYSTYHTVGILWNAIRRVGVGWAAFRCWYVEYSIPSLDPDDESFLEGVLYMSTESTDFQSHKLGCLGKPGRNIDGWKNELYQK